ncbi:hypothetical protein C2S52_013918 [Perilla frutescens var. hirtella]|nr:hypothetical protein C2S52_013918 [Perilla frutescens var. hirtella]
MGDIHLSSRSSVAWERVCAIKEEEGLGVTSLVQLSKSLAMRLAWKVLTNNTDVYELFRRRYLNRTCHVIKPKSGSSIWQNIKGEMSVLVEGSHMLLGNGKNILFWLDNWLEYRLVDKLNIPVQMHASLLDSVADFLHEGVWIFTADFLLSFLEVVWDIIQVLIMQRDDEMVWKRSLHGEVTTKVTKLCIRSHFAEVQWGNWIWHRLIPVRRSITYWRAILGRLPTMEKCRRIGFIGPLFCSLCRKEEESLYHVFYGCSVVRQAWQWLFGLFNIEDQSFSSFNELFMFCLNHKSSSQVWILWRIGVVSLVWGVWNARNRATYNDFKPSFHRLAAVVRIALRESSMISAKMGFMHNTMEDLSILRAVGVKGRIQHPKVIKTVIWKPPPRGWVKINTDGSAVSEPGNLACGGIFQNHMGSVIACFHENLGVGFVYEAELWGAILAIDFAISRGMTHIWLEVDSMLVLRWFAKETVLIPWRVKARLLRVLQLIQGIHFKVSHIYREGNQIADKLASTHFPEGWWSHLLPEVNALVESDFFGRGYIRLCDKD